MPNTQQIKKGDNAGNDPAFKLAKINIETGEVTLIIKKGILGAMSNQLQNTSNKRKGSSIIRRMGYLLSDCGDVLYEQKSMEETDLAANQIDEGQHS